MPHSFRTVTVTGADDSVDPGDLLRFLLANPAAEAGVLWGGPEKEGRPRYPTFTWLKELGAAARLSPVRLALHLCARAEKCVAEWPGESPSADAALAALGLPMPAAYSRIQMNRALGSMLPGRERFRPGRMQGMQTRLRERGANFILQVKERVEWSARHAGECLSPGEILLDASGGRGLLPAEWPALAAPSRLRVGYAGGLSPGNLQAELTRIGAACGGAFHWVDMETSLRREGANGSDHGFSLDLAKAAVDEASAWRSRNGG